MTSIRKGFVFSAEDSFGKGKGASNVWIAPPPGSYISNTHTRQTTRVQGTGSKTWDTVAYGQLTGSWEWTFMLDYDYLEPLLLVFEDYTAPTEAAAPYTHVFKKKDAARVGSFVIRQKVLNRMAGGPVGSDELEELVGCVCTDITFARASGSSQMQVTMSGFYADESMLKGALDATDYQPYSGTLAEYSCLFLGGTGEDCYIGDLQSMSFAISNGCDPVGNVCSHVAKNYSEGTSKYTLSMSTYSNDPSKVKQRVYSGGKSKTAQKPMGKGMMPVPEAYILSYDQEVDSTHPTHDAAYNASAHSLKVKIEEAVIRSLQWQNGDGSKLMDSISSTECKRMTLTFRTDVASYNMISGNVHAVTSPDPI